MGLCCMAGIIGDGCWAGVEANEFEADEDDEVSVYRLLMQIFMRSIQYYGGTVCIGTIAH